MQELKFDDGKNKIIINDLGEISVNLALKSQMPNAFWTELSKFIRSLSAQIKEQTKQTDYLKTLVKCNDEIIANLKEDIKRYIEIRAIQDLIIQDLKLMQPPPIEKKKYININKKEMFIAGVVYGKSAIK